MNSKQPPITIVSKSLSKISNICQIGRLKWLSVIGFVMLLVQGFVQPASAANGNDTWLGNADANWSTAANWNPAINAPPIAGDFLFFGVAGSKGALLTNDIVATGISTNVAGITFNPGASAFTLTGTNLSVLAGGITNSSTALQMVSFPITNTASRTLVTTPGGGNIAINGGVSGTGGAFSMIGGGTLTLGGANTYTAGTTVNGGVLTFTGDNVLPTVGNLSLLGSSSVLDLTGTSQSTVQLIGTDANNATPTGSYVTNSGAGTPVLTLNEGTGNNFQFREGILAGPLKLAVIGSLMQQAAGAGTAFQIQVAGNTYSGGTLLQGLGTTPLSTINLAAAGGFITAGAGSVTNTSAMRINNGVNPGIGTITLDNGEVWTTAANNITNAISVTARGGVLRTENNLSAFSGSVSGSGLLVLVCSQGAFSLSNDLSGFTGTLAVDTSSGSGIGTLNLCSNSPSGSLLFFGAGGKTGIVQYSGPANPITLPFTEVSCGVNGGSTAVGSLSSGAAAAVTYQLGDNTANTPVFGGIVQNGGGMVAVTKIGTDTQTLSGVNTYTGPTIVNGGVLVLNGVNNGSGGYTVNNNATLNLGGTGNLLSNATVNVNAGGTIARGGTIGGLVTLASGNAAINLQDAAIAALTLTNGLTLNNGNMLSFDLGGSADSIAITGGTYTKNSGTVTVNVTGTGFSAGIYPLITGGSISSTNGYVLGTTPANPSFTYALTSSSGNLALQVILAVVAPPNAFWKGGVNNNWSMADGGGLFNWATTSAGTISTGAKPGVPSAATFSATGAANQSTILGGNFEIASLAITTPSTIGIGGANTLQLDAGGLTINSGAGAVTISNSSVVLGGTELWTNNSTSTLSVSAPISGLSVLTLGGGLTVLSGTNSHGGTMMTGGKLALSGSGTLGSSTASAGAIGGAIDLGGSSQSVGAVSLKNGGVISNGVLTASSSYDLQSGTISAVLGGGSGVIANKTTTDTVILSANNTFGGQTTISNGVLQIGIGGASGTFNPASIDIGNTATLLFDSSVSQTNTSLISDGGQLIVKGGGLVQFGNQLSSFTNNILADGSTLAASGGNNSINPITGPLGNSTVARTVTLTNGATLSLVGGNVFGSGAAVSTTVAIVANQGSQIVLNANDANILGPVFLNGGQLIVGNGFNNSFQGAILANGVIVAGTTNSIISSNGSDATRDGVMLGAIGHQAAENFTPTPFDVAVTGSTNPDLIVSASLVDPAFSPTVGGTTAGDGGVEKDNNGTMLLSGINPYSGPTFVTAGKLVVSSIQGATGMTNNVSVNDSATLGVIVSGSSQWSPSSATLGVGGANTLEFTGVNSTTIAPLNPGVLSISGTTTINIISAVSVVGTYPLVNNWDTSGSIVLGTLPANVLAAHLDTSTSIIKLIITQVSGPSLTTPTLTNSFSGGNLTLTWPADHTGYHLQVQTNTLSTGLSTNWANWPGAEATNQETIPINTINGSVFFRLLYP